MGKRKERRHAAQSAAGRRVKLDLWTDDVAVRIEPTDIWWRNYGTKAPNLRKFAIRILSQTCSSSDCERNWSVFEKIHSKKRNRLAFSRLNDMVYVHYNLRLWMKQIDKEPDVKAISLDNIDILSKWRVEVEVPLLEEKPGWLEEGDQQQQQQEEEEEEEDEQVEEEQDDVPVPLATHSSTSASASSSASSSASASASASTSVTDRHIVDRVPTFSSSGSRPGKLPLIFSRRRGRGHGY